MDEEKGAELMAPFFIVQKLLLCSRQALFYLERILSLKAACGERSLWKLII